MAPEWELLRETRGEHAIESAERLLSSIKATIEAKPPVYYNVNSHLVDGAAWVLGVADAVEGWGSGLSQVLDEYCAMNRETVRLGSLLLLESLDLTNRRMDLTAAYGIAALVYLSPTLTEVIVSSNNFGDAGVAAIATAAGANPNSRLQSLFLNNTHAGERASRALLQMVQTNRSLTKLSLRQNGELDGETRQALARACEGRGLNLDI